jgi:hypothetical protein
VFQNLADKSVLVPYQVTFSRSRIGKAFGGIGNILPCLSGQPVAHFGSYFCAFAQPLYGGRAILVQAFPRGPLNQFIVDHGPRFHTQPKRAVSPLTSEMSDRLQLSLEGQNFPG